jgi:hypothetical protein
MRLSKLKIIALSALLSFYGGIASGEDAVAPADSEPAKRHSPWQRLYHLIGLDIGGGADTDPDILRPFLPEGIARLLEWDHRVTLRHNGIGVNSYYRHPGRIQKLTLSYRERMDIPEKLGLGPTRDRLYENAGGTAPRDDSGFILGSAAVFNPYWGASARYDERRVEDAAAHFGRRVFAVGLGYMPLGANEGRRWNISLEPTVSHEREHHFRPGDNVRFSGYGYSGAVVYVQGLDWIRIPFVLGPKKKARLDRLTVSLRAGDGPGRRFSTGPAADMTAYVTRFVKLSAGLSHSYEPRPGRHSSDAKFGASLRVAWSDLPF